MSLSRDSLKIKLFADGADLAGMIEMASKPYIAGLTTNPTLMRKSGVSDYVKFAQEVVREIPNKPISFEVFSDDLDEMKSQALRIASWGENIYVKIPVTNTLGVSTLPLVGDLLESKVKVNVTAIMTTQQVSRIAKVLGTQTESYVSVFAGRIADTGRDPIPTMLESLELIKDNQLSQLIWASPRELLNIIQADSIGCHIITATTEILNKLKFLEYDLEAFSLDTVKMFSDDAKKSGYEI
jgi:transaldolase